MDAMYSASATSKGGRSGHVRSSDGFVDLTAELVVRLPGVEREMAEKLVSCAHDVCPYSRSTRGNIPVELRIEDS